MVDVDRNRLAELKEALASRLSGQSAHPPRVLSQADRDPGGPPYLDQTG